MASIQFEMAKCPQCNKGVDVHILSVSSLIGPAAVQCAWCGEAVAVDRIEWHNLTRVGRCWFFFVSLIYAVLAFFIGGLSVDGGIELLRSGKFSQGWNFHEPEFWISGAATSLAIIVIQAFRVRSSHQRLTASEVQLSNSLLTFDVGGQLKVLLLSMIFPATAWGLSKFVFNLPDQTRVLVQAGVLGFVAIVMVGGIWFYNLRIQSPRRLHPESLVDRPAEAREQMTTITREDTIPDCCVICGEAGTTRVRLRFPPIDQATSEVHSPSVFSVIRKAIPSITWSLPFCDSHSGFPVLWQRLQLPLLLIGVGFIGSAVWLAVATNLLWPIGVAIVASVLSIYCARPLSITTHVVSKYEIKLKTNDRFSAALHEGNQFRVSDNIENSS